MGARATGPDMARYAFYEIRSARSADAETDPGGAPLYRRSFACAERDDLSLFVWMDAEDTVQMFQLLFRERFVTWSRRQGLEVGVTSRHRVSPFGEVRQQGVRTLHGAVRDEADAIVEAARELLARAELPDAIDEPVRAALA